MSKVRRMLALGLLLGGTGCAGLQRGGFTQPPVEHNHPLSSTTIDPFHPPVESTGTRISRFFPGLSRPERAEPAIVDTLRKGNGRNSLSAEDLRAVPRPEPDFDYEGDDTTSLPSRADRAVPRTRSEPDPLHRGTATETPDLQEPADVVDAPLLQAAIVAEVDPAETKPEIVIEPVRNREHLEARIAAAALSPRRMPPMPEISPQPQRSLPPRDVAAVEDRQTRRARVRDDETMNHQAGQPLLAVAQVLPDADRYAGGPPPMETLIVAPEEKVTEPAPEAPTEETDEPIADVAASTEPIGDPILDAPPAIEPEAEAEAEAEADEVNAPRPEEPQNEPQAVERRTRVNPVGRPRLALSSRRDHLPPDVPAATFPRSYYGKDPLPQNQFPLDEQTEPGRWTWRPRILKRLRGE